MAEKHGFEGESCSGWATLPAEVHLKPCSMGWLMNGVKRIAPDAYLVRAGVGNAFLVGTRQSWTLLDCGMPGYAHRIRQAAEHCFGNGTRPDAIILTHGHFDHAGSAAELSDGWDVPVYAHRMEIPYLTGKSKYPPPDPTVGGFMALLMRFLPNKAFDLGNRIRELEVENLPGMSGWECIETPGHSPGHVSFFYPADSVLLAGDAFTTINQASLWDVVTRKVEVCPPPTYYTCDWESAQISVRRLAELEPRTVAAGHGEPMLSPDAARQLRSLAENFPIPEHGRYYPNPARANEQGVYYLPPPVPDPFKRNAAIAGGVVAAGIAGLVIATRKRAA